MGSEHRLVCSSYGTLASGLLDIEAFQILEVPLQGRSAQKNGSYDPGDAFSEVQVLLPSVLEWDLIGVRFGRGTHLGLGRVIKARVIWILASLQPTELPDLIGEVCGIIADSLAEGIQTAMGTVWVLGVVLPIFGSFRHLILALSTKRITLLIGNADIRMSRAVAIFVRGHLDSSGLRFRLGWNGSPTFWPGPILSDCKRYAKLEKKSRGNKTRLLLLICQWDKFIGGSAFVHRLAFQTQPNDPMVPNPTDLDPRNLGLEKMQVEIGGDEVERPQDQIVP